MVVGSISAPDIDLWDALERLNVPQRAVIFLVYWEDLTEVEVAQRLGISERTVRRRLAHARHTLGEVLS